MKHIKIYLLVIFVVCVVGNISAQSRLPNGNKLVIQTQSEKLRTAVGWKQDFLSNWVSNSNAIAETKLNEETVSTVSQSFKWLQLALLKNGNQDVYALLFENTAYVSGSKNERRVYFFLMTSKSYAKLFANIANKGGDTLSIHSSFFGFMSDNDSIYTADKLLQLISQSLSKEDSDNQFTFSINAQHVDNGDVVRFRLPEKSNITDNGLQEGYFEVVWEDFNKILLPVSPSVDGDEFSLGSNASVSSGMKDYSDNQVKSQLGDDMDDRNTPQSQNFGISDDKQQRIEEASSKANVTNAEEVSDRITREKSFISAPIATLSNIEGWYLAPDGEWVNSKSYLYQFETVGRYEMRNFVYRQKAYLMIIRYEKYAGATYYLLPKDEYLQAIDHLESSSMIKLPVIVYAPIGNRLEDMIALCEKTLDTPVKENAIVTNIRYIVLQYKLSKVRNISRFFFFLQECSKYSSDISENCMVKVSNDIRYDDEPLLLTESLFAKMYYESTFTSFMDFFRKPLSGKSTTSPSQELDMRSQDW